MTATASKSAADRKKGDTEVAATPAIAALRASYAVDSDPRLQRTGPSAGLRPVRLDYGFAVEKRSDEENSLEPLVSFGRRLLVNLRRRLTDGLAPRANRPIQVVISASHGDGRSRPSAMKNPPPGCAYRAQRFSNSGTYSSTHRRIVVWETMMPCCLRKKIACFCRLFASI
jgi:hypothetical protein